MSARNPIVRFSEPGATLMSNNVKQWSVLVDVTTNDQNQVQLPAGPRALRLAGLSQVGQTPVLPAAGDPIPLFKDGRAYTNLAVGKSCVPGDLAVIANNAGDTEPYVLGTGTAQVIGPYKTKYTNGQSASVPVETDYQPMLLVQAEQIRGFVRTVTANNTRYAGNDATEVSADETIFEARWAGTLQGPLRVDVEASGGVPAGTVTAKVRIKIPGGSWATAQVGATPADWATVVALSNTVTSGDDTTLQLPWGNSLAIPKGTKVAIQFIKDNAVANIAQLSGSLRFV